MAKGQHLSHHQKGIVRNYYEHQNTIFTTKLATIVSDLAVCASPAESGKLWARAAELLLKCQVDAPSVAKIRADKNLEALARIVGDLSVGKQPAKVPGAGAPPAAAAPPGGIVDPDAPAAPAAGGAAPATPVAPETLKAALTAFKKRLKLTRLNEESRLSPRPMTGGKKSEIAGILPPDQFPRPVWDELARQGKLTYLGRGFFELVEGA